MPKTTQKHRNHGVEIGIDMPSLLGITQGCPHHQQCQKRHRRSNPKVAAEDKGRHADDENPEESAEGDVPVSSKGNVEVVLQPTRERDVPTLPKVGTVGSLIRRVEILGEIESHELGEAYRNVGVSREIGIYLKGINKECHEVLETGKEGRVGKYSVDEIHCQEIGKDYLLQKTVQDPKHSHTELHTAQMIRTIQLGNEVGSLDDGTCHQLGKEGHIEPEIEDVAHRFHKSPVDIGRITDHLERIEGDSHGKNDSVHTPELALGEKVSRLSSDVGHLEVRAKQVIHHIGEEITVLEIAQNGQIHKDTQHQKSLALPLPVVSETVDEPRYRVVGAGDENEQSHKKSARLIIEKEADKEKIGILQRTKRHDRATYVLLPLGGERHKQGETAEHKGEEYPELQLGEKQRTMRVEGKDTLDIGYQTRHNVDFFLLEVM